MAAKEEDAGEEREGGEFKRFPGCSARPPMRAAALRAADHGRALHAKSRYLAWNDFPVAVGIFGLGQIMRRLQIEPETRIGAEVTPKPDGSVRGNVAGAAHDFGEAVGRYIQQFRQRARRQAERHEKFLAKD